MLNKLRNFIVRKLGGRILPINNQGANIDREELSNYPNKELIEIIVDINNVTTKPNEMYWFKQYIICERKCERLSRGLRLISTSPKYFDRILTISSLEYKIRNLKKEVRNMQEVAEYRNKQMAACNLITYCTGGCDGGISDKDSMTEDKVVDVETIARRLRAWWNNYQYKKKREQ